MYSIKNIDQIKVLDYIEKNNGGENIINENKAYNFSCFC